MSLHEEEEEEGDRSRLLLSSLREQTKHKERKKEASRLMGRKKERKRKGNLLFVVQMSACFCRSGAYRYALWCRKTKRRIQRVGEEEDAALVSSCRYTRGQSRNHAVSSDRDGEEEFPVQKIRTVSRRFAVFSRSIFLPASLLPEDS